MTIDGEVRRGAGTSPKLARAPPLAGIHFNFNHWIKGSINTVKRSILILKRLNHMEHLMDEKLQQENAVDE